MSDQQDLDIQMPDPVEMSAAMTQIAERSQRLVTDFLKRQAEDPHVGMADPMNVGGAFLEMTARMMADPAKIVEAQVNNGKANIGNLIKIFQTGDRQVSNYP